MKRYTAFLLTLIFALSLIPAGAALADDGENLALNKPVTATSEYSAFYNMPAVNDGKMSTAWSEGSVRVAPDDKDGRSWIQIDLGARYDIKSMIAYSRSDVNNASERMGWYYQVAESEDFSDGVTIGVKNSPGDPGSGYEVSLRKPVTGRYVRVACSEYFVIAEIEVYGTLAPEKAKGQYEDIEAEGKIYNASQIVYHLGIMEGISPTEFGYGYIMTRAEAAEAAARLQGSGELDLAETGFSDVPLEHEKSGYIAWCEGFGTVQKGEFFRPDDYITVPEFLTMLLRMNGWFSLAQDGEYPSNVINVAQNRVKLTKGVDIDLYGNLNRSGALLLIYNMLISNTLHASEVSKKSVGYTLGDTYLEETFDLALYNGIVEETAHTGLVEAIGAGTSRITVDGVKYKDLSESGTAYLGEKVYFLCDKDENITHIWRNPQIGTRLTVMCADVLRSDQGGISYYDKASDKELRVSLESPVYFIKNGAASGDFSLSKLNPENGKLVLIDNNNDGTYDVIKLYEPEVIVVDYVGVDGKRLSIGAQNYKVGDDGKRNYNNIEVPSFEELTVTRNGFPMKYGEIPSGALIYAYVSDNKKHVELEVSIDNVTGTVDSFTDTEVTLNGFTYSFSDYYKANRDPADGFGIGDKVKLILDENGFVVWVINSSVTATAETLSVILAVSKHTNSLKPFEIRVFNERNEMPTLTCAGKVLVDGTQMNTSDLMALPEDYFVGKAAKYRLNSDGLVTYLNTEAHGTNEPEDKMSPQAKWSLPSGSGRCEMGFYSDTNMVLPVYEDFPVFTIGKDVDGNIISDEALKGSFSYKGINTLYPPTSDNESKGDFTFYGDEDDDSPAFAVSFVTVNTDKNFGTITAYTSNNTMVVDKIAYMKSGDDYTYRIYGFNAATGASLNIAVSPEITAVVDSYIVYITKQTGGTLTGISFTGLNYISPTNSTGVQANYSSPVGSIGHGDILRYEGNNESITGLERIYNPKDTLSTDYKGHILNTGDNYGKSYRAGYRAFSGAVSRVENGIIEIDNGESFSYKNSSIKNFLVVDNDDTITAYATALMPMYAEPGDNVFVVTLSGKASYLIIYK